MYDPSVTPDWNHVNYQYELSIHPPPLPHPHAPYLSPVTPTRGLYLSRAYCSRLLSLSHTFVHCVREHSPVYDRRSINHKLDVLLFIFLITNSLYV